MSKLSPINSFVANQGINVNPMSQKGLLKYAVNKPVKEKKNPDSSEDDGDYSKFKTKKNIDIEKQKRLQELENLKQNGKDIIDNSSAIRLPNRISKGVVIDS